MTSSARPAASDLFTARNATDAGDTTSRNYRYQYAYGVILLAAAQRGDAPYIALWCEHHEDFLAQRNDGRFDGYQIKTSRPELGAWNLNDEDLIKSIGRFVDLRMLLGDALAEVVFVSNTECETITARNKDESREARCPAAFLEHVKACADVSDLRKPFSKTFSELRAKCACGESELLDTLKRMKIVLGPSRSDFEAVTSHDHLAHLDECRNLNRTQLDAFRDQVMSTVHKASSLSVNDPLRHIVQRTDAIPPEVLAKRILVSSIRYSETPLAHTVVRFADDAEIALGEPRQGAVLEEKLKKGGLEEQIDYMQAKERAAEYHLLSDIQRRPEVYPDLFNQVVAMVYGECMEARNKASLNGLVYGPSMLADVEDRLRKLAVDRPATVGSHPYECLMGVAALLTSSCRLWWSERFKIPPGAV